MKRIIFPERRRMRRTIELYGQEFRIVRVKGRQFFKQDAEPWREYAAIIDHDTQTIRIDADNPDPDATIARLIAEMHDRMKAIAPAIRPRPSEKYERKYPKAKAPTVTIDGVTYAIVEAAEQLRWEGDHTYDGRIDCRHNILWLSPNLSQEKRERTIARLVADASLLPAHKITRPRYASWGLRQPVFVGGANYDIADSARSMRDRDGHALDYRIDHFFQIIWLAPRLSAGRRIVILAQAVADAAEYRLRRWANRQEELQPCAA